MTENGRIVCGGSNHNGQIGIQGTKLGEYEDTENFADLFEYIEPFTVPTFLDIKSIFVTCGPRSTASVSTKKKLFIWGTLTAEHMYSIPTL